MEEYRCGAATPPGSRGYEGVGTDDAVDALVERRASLKAEKDTLELCGLRTLPETERVRLGEGINGGIEERTKEKARSN